MVDAETQPDVPVGWTQPDVERVLAAAARAWPDLAPPGAAFVSHLASREPALPRTLEADRIGDLYLAHRCAMGDEDAISTLETIHRGAIATSLARVDSNKHQPADLAQMIRQHLFVGPKPAVESYSGSGSLAAWLGVVSLRTALNAVRGRKTTTVSIEDDDDSAVGDLAEIEDPELDFLRDKYRADFRAAFEAAVTDLTQRERLLLRQHMVEKLTVRELGRLHGVHSATVSRWITAARDGLAERTCAALRHQLDVTPEELQSIMHMIRSRVELSLTRALAK